ncbi:MAG: 3-isopropylmalate dehydratase, partial [Novosphingobium sp.]|nr:3-isopropylmalate dehydratase [Novosphingobium sp.]
LRRFGVGGGSGHVVEYAGRAVRDLEIEGRLTLCNMGTEFAAFTAIVAPDEKTLDHL